MAQALDLVDLSPSADRAVQLARAAAVFRLARQDGPPHGIQPGASGVGSPAQPPGIPAALDASVGPADLLVGVLLAHPDAQGEGRVLLSHFGLTARDVLPGDYPRVDFDELRQRAATVPTSIDPAGLVELSGVLGQARRHGEGRASLRHLLGALLESSQPLRWGEAFGRRGTEWTTVLDSYRRWLGAERAANGRGGGHPIAGDRLQSWLVRENPRRPVDVPLFASDQVDGSLDLVGVQYEADAFAYLIASCDLTPPLSIGLFGDWGSGKSFLMRAIDQRLDILTRNVADQDQSRIRIWKHIDRIEFNAWEYVQGNLWAGLLQRIFSALGTLQPHLLEERRRPVQGRIAETQRQIEQIDGSLASLRGDEIAPAEKAVQDAEAEVDKARTEAAARLDSERRQQAQQEARDALRQLWGRLPVFLLDMQGRDLVEALDQAREELQRGRALVGAYWRRPSHVAMVTLGALLVPIVTWGLTALGAGPGASVLGGLTALVPIVTSTLSSAARWSRDRLSELEAAEAKVQQRIQQPVLDKEEELRVAREHLEEIAERYRQVEQERERTDQERAQLEATLAQLTPERILVEFADQRNAAYGSQLGLLAQVRRDLLAVEQAVIEHNDTLRKGTGPADRTQDGEPRTAEPGGTEPGGDGVAPRGVPNRIVLYIDDLDRCPPDTVLDVLEAVHLLLSFRMFVVVVAVDSRWLTSALTEKLVALRPAPDGPTGAPVVDRATPKDYLEKIFQLPFWVQPVPPPGRAQLVHGLLSESVRHGDGTGAAAPADDEKGVHLSDREREAVEAMLTHYGVEVRLDTSPLALDPGDLEFLEGLAVLLGDTPRRVKRFVNTCQLLYAMAPPLNESHGFPRERHVVALVCAISDGLPATAQHLLPLLAACSPSVPDRTAQALNDAASTLLAYTTGLPDESRPPAPIDPSAVERRRLLAWLDANPAWKAVTLAQLDVRLDMIRRLRFDRLGP